MKKLLVYLISFFVLICDADSHAYERFINGAEKSDFYVNFDKSSGSADLKVCVYHKNDLKYSRYLSDYSFRNFADYKADNLYIYRKHGMLILHFFDEGRNLSYDLGFSLDGTVDLSCGENHTGNNVSFAIRTFGDIINKHPISFYRLYTCGNSINNSSVLMIKKPYLLHHYYYNSGVWDFKNEFKNGIAMNDYYLNLFSTFVNKKQAGYNFKKNSLDNEGVIISNNLRAGEERSSGLQINVSGAFIGENFKLCGQHNSINTDGHFIVSKTLSGDIDNLNIGKAIVQVGKTVTNSIGNVDNRGNFILTEDNDLQIENLNNLGQITGLKNLSLLVKALDGGGAISAKGALRLISQAKHEIAQKLDNRAEGTGKINNVLLGSERTIKHITDHYLNRITIYRDQYGRETGRSETGYLFQRREEKEEKVPMSRKEQMLLNSILDDTHDVMSRLNDAFRALERMEEAILKCVDNYEKKYGSSDSLKVNLRSLLQAHGISLQQQSRMINNFMSIPYSCNAMRLDSDVATSIDISMCYKDFLQDLADLEYERKAAAKKSKRKSWDDVQHVKNITSASREFSLESAVANVTLIRYEFEQWKERNPEAYEAFLKSIDAYNSAVLSRGAALALINAPETMGASVLSFACGVSLWASLEYITSLISNYGADKIARYCAGDDMIKFASYLKTCEFCFKFISEHGITGGINRKLAKATASANTYLHPTTTGKPIVYERRASAQVGSGTTKKAESGKTSGGVKYSERVMLQYGKGRFWEGLKSGKEDQKLIHLKRKAKCEIRTDGTYFYKFDPGHQSAKVHLHKYRHQGGDKYKLIAEVNPETGEVKLINGDCEIW